MAYKINGKRYYNSEEFTVQSFNETHMCLTNDDIDINDELKFTNHFTKCCSDIMFLAFYNYYSIHFSLF